MGTSMSSPPKHGAPQNRQLTKMANEPVEYLVEKVLEHRPFKQLIRETRAGTNQFNPDSVQTDQRVHSKYGYLVQWENYGVGERTWEPEENLGTVEALLRYKRKVGLPEKHETIEKVYGMVAKEELTMGFGRVTGISHLTTAKEKRTAREDMQGRIQALADREKAAKEKTERRERMTTPEDPEDVRRRKEFTIPKKKRVIEVDSPKSSDHESENRNQTNRPEQKSSEASSSQIMLPGIQPLSEFTPKIQKRVGGGSADSSARSSTETPSGFQATSTISPPSVHCEPESSRKSMKDRFPDYMVPVKPTEVKKAGKILLEKRPSIEILEVREKAEEPPERKDELEAKIQDVTVEIKQKKKEIEQLQRKLSKYPVEIAVPRATRSFAASLEMMRARRWKSLENLNEFWAKNTEIELAALNFERITISTPGMPKSYTLKIIEQTENSAKASPSRERLEDLRDRKLAEENWNRVKGMKVLKKLDKNFSKFLKKLVVAFSHDLSVHFEQLFEQTMADSRLDALRYIAIVLITTQCRHKYWRCDGTSRPLFESKSTGKDGNIRRQETECCHNHRKCTWIEIFMKLMPVNMRFLETSECSYHGIVDEDDGPFRDDIFFYCMKQGSECQKILFFKYSKPIGIQEDEEGEFSVDVMHLLAVQFGNIQRIGWYMAEGGVDINALATHTATNQVYRLREYLKKWRVENVDGLNDEHISKYYQRVYAMVSNAAAQLEIFVESIVTKMIARRMAGRYRILKQSVDMTHPHILRCSPCSNKSNGGDGTHQVLSCLFMPNSIGLRNGMPDHGSGPFDSRRMAELRDRVKNYRELVAEGKGRIVLAVLRIKIGFHAKLQPIQPFSLPTYDLVESDRGFNIEKMTILRQKEGLDAEEADLNMEEMKSLSSPGCRYFVLSSKTVEQELVVPGNAHIEMLGEVDEPISFVVQVLFIKKQASP